MFKIYPQLPMDASSEFFWPISENIFDDFIYKFVCKTFIPFCGLPLTLRIIIGTNLNRHYLKMKISLCIPVYEFAPPPSPPRFWPILPLGIMICQNLYLLYLMLPRKVSSLLAECVLERRYLKTFLNTVLCINSNPLF